MTDRIDDILKYSKVVAVVGLSSKPHRPSHGVARYLQSQGYRIIPVNPYEDVVLGEKAYPTLESVPVHIDTVDIFRRAEAVAPVVESAIKARAKAIWMQEGVINEEAARRAREAGLDVVMDRCMLKEHKKRLT